MRSNAARARKTLLPAEPMTMDEVNAYMGIVFRGVIAKKVDPGVANAASRAAEVLAKLAGITDFEHQLAEMRREIIELSDRRLA